MVEGIKTLIDAASYSEFNYALGTWNVQIETLHQNLQQLESVIGMNFVHALQPVIKVMDEATGHVISFAKTVSGALGNIFGWTYEESGGGFWQDFEKAEESTANLTGYTGKIAKNVEKARKGIRTFDELKTIGGSDPGGFESTGEMGNGGESGAPSGKWVPGESLLKSFESEIDSLYELGKYIGDTIAQVLRGIDWDFVYEEARNFGSGLAEFLNGLISPGLFGEVGRTIAGALNTVVYAALAFGEEFNWEKFGLSIATGLNSFFTTFDFATLAQAIQVWAKGILDTMIIAFDETDWGLIGEKIGEFLADIDLLGIGMKIGEVIWKSINAGIELFAGTFKKAPIETILISLVSVPRLLKAIVASEFVTGLKKLVDGIKLTSSAIAGNTEASALLMSQYPKLGKAIDVAKDSFWALKTGIIDGDFGTGLNLAIENIRSNLTGLQKGAITAIAGFAEFKIVSGVFEGLAFGTENVVSGLAKIGVAVAAAGTAMYVSLGPAGLAIAGITGVVAAIKGTNDAISEMQLNSMFEAISTNGVTSLEALGNVAQSTFGEITSGVDASIEKLNSISQTRESVDGTVESIGNIKSAIDNGAYSVSEKVPQIIEQFQSLLNDSKTVLESEYDVIVGNVVGAWADVLIAQGESIPEVVAGLLDMTNEGSTALANLEGSLNSLIEQYNNGEISAEDFYSQSEPLFNQLSALNSDGSVDSATTAIQNLGGALDMSQYIKDGTFDATAFQSYMGTVVQAAQDGKNNLETLRIENQETLDAYRQQLEGLGVDTANYDWAALYGASEMQVSQGISEISSAYQDYANQVQYCLLEQLPIVVEDATLEYEKLDWWKKLFTTKEEYVQEEIDKWRENVLTPATSSLQMGFEELGIEGELWADNAAGKMSASLFDTFTEYSYWGVPTTITTLKNDWETILANALGGAAEAVDAGTYAKSTVDGYTDGITENEESSTKKIQEWMESLDKAIHDSALEYGSPSKKTENYGKWAVEGFNKGIFNNLFTTEEMLRFYMGNVERIFSGTAGSFEKIGINAMNGMQNGLLSVEGSLYNKVHNIAQNITNIIKTALDIHSPSRVMFKLGNFTMEGFKEGMEILYNPITNSIKSFGRGVAVATQPSLSDVYGSRIYIENERMRQYGFLETTKNNYDQSKIETNALLRRQNELLERILAKPNLSNADVFNAAKAVYRGEVIRRYGESNVFDPVWG